MGDVASRVSGRLVRVFADKGRLWLQVDDERHVLDDDGVSTRLRESGGRREFELVRGGVTLMSVNYRVPARVARWLDATWDAMDEEDADVLLWLHHGMEDPGWVAETGRRWAGGSVRRTVAPPGPFGALAQPFYQWVIDDHGFVVVLSDDTELRLLRDDRVVDVAFDPREQEVQTEVRILAEPDEGGFDLECLMYAATGGLDLRQIRMDVRKFGFEACLTAQSDALRRYGGPILACDLTDVPTMRAFQQQRLRDVMPWWR